MFILIDTDQLRMVAAAQTRKWINLVSYVDFGSLNSKVIVDSQELRTWSSLTAKQIAQIYINMSGAADAPGYGDAIKQLADYAETWAPYSKSEKALEVEAEAIYQAEEAAKTDEDRVAEARQAEKQARANHQAIITMAEEANAALSPEQKAQAAAAPKQAAAKPPTEPQVRPQQGATKKIWDIADDLLAVTGNVGNIKAFRKQVIDRAEAMGLNPGTAATQFGKWKAAKGL